jgi:VanZ family protein
MPFTLVSPLGLKEHFLHQFWSHWPFNPAERISGSDLISNLALYLPLGFLLATRTTLTKNTSTMATILRALIICSTLSLGIELLQHFIINRVPSASDWLFNSLSGLAGAAAGAVLGQRYFDNAIIWIRQRWEQSPLDILTLLLLLLLCADALAPFLPTIKLSQVWRSLKRSHFDLREGFALHPWHWWIMIKVQTFHLLSLMIAFWNGAAQNQRHRAQVACITTIFALGLELMKPMIDTRDINMANVVASSAGAFLILITGPAIVTRISRKNILSLAIISLLCYLLYLGWAPFDFHWNLQVAKHKLPINLKELLPLYHYAMGATLEHARLFTQSIILAGILVYLLRIRYTWFNLNTNIIYLALLIGVVIGILQEGGQLFLFTRTPSMTDIYCFMTGAYLGTKVPINKRL